MYRDKYHVDILFFVEHKDRELDVVCAIAKKLKDDYCLSVSIASTIYHSLLSALFVRPKVVVSPSPGIGPGSVISLFREVYGDKITYVNLNMEQFLSSMNISVRIPKDSFTKSKLKQFCWGKRFKEFLVGNGVSENNVYITGRPAATLLIEKAAGDRSSLKKNIAERFGLSPELSWLFFPMSCGMAFASDYHMQTRIDAGWDERSAWAYKDYVSSALDIIFRWLARLKDQVTGNDYLVILRPHPSVSVQQYEERFADVVGYVPPYVYISKMLTAHEWLLASDACYATLSSVAIDSNIVGIPTYRIEPKPFPPFLEGEEWLKGLPRLRSFKEFCSTITNGLYYLGERSEFIDEYIELDLDGICETAKHLAAFAKEGAFSSWSPVGFIRAITSSPRRRVGSLLRFIAAATGINFFRVIPSGLHPDYFDRHDIIERLQTVVNKYPKA